MSKRLFHEVKKRSHKIAAAFRNEGGGLLLFHTMVRGPTIKRLNHSVFLASC